MKVDAILTTDWHLRETVPPFRSGENFWGIQWKKVRYISQLQEKYGCPVIHAGDLFHHWKASPFLLSMAIKRLPKQFYTIYGNHDLPKHSIQLADKSAMNTLQTSGTITILPGNHFGEKNPTISITIENRNIMVWHVYNSLSSTGWEGEDRWLAKRMRDTFTEADLILTGDNHQPFTVVEKGKNIVVNPGPLTRQTVDLSTLEPRVYLWEASTNTVEPVFLPLCRIPTDDFEREQNQKRNERIEEFIKKLNQNWEVDVNFEENLKNFYSVNAIKTSIRELIQSAIEEG